MYNIFAKPTTLRPDIQWKCEKGEREVKNISPAKSNTQSHFLKRINVCSAGVHKISTLKLFPLVVCIFILGSFVGEELAQPECEAWGNLTGIGVDGVLMEFESSLRIVQPDWKEIIQTAKQGYRAIN